MRKMIVWMAAVATLVSGCSTADAGRGREAPRTLSAAEVEANARVHLPPGTVLLSTTYQGFQDWRLTAAFRVPSTALPGFLSSGGFPEPTPGLRAVTDADRPDSDTWRPDAATTVAGLDQTDHPVDGVFRKLLLDRSRPAEVTVFLVAFTT